MKASFEIFSLMLLLEREEQKLASTGTRRHTNEEICDFLGMEAPAFAMPDMKGAWLTKSAKLALYNTYLTGPVSDQTGSDKLWSIEKTQNMITMEISRINARLGALEEVLSTKAS